MKGKDMFAQTNPLSPLEQSRNAKFMGWCYALVLVGLLFLGAGCESSGLPSGTQIGLSGNPTNVTGSIAVPVNGNAIITATGTINPEDPNQWDAGIMVTLRSYDAELVNAIASVPGSTYNIYNPYEFRMLDDGSGVRSDSKLNLAIQKLLAADAELVQLSAVRRKPTGVH